MSLFEDDCTQLIEDCNMLLTVKLITLRLCCLNDTPQTGLGTVKKCFLTSCSVWPEQTDAVTGKDGAASEQFFHNLAQSFVLTGFHSLLIKARPMPVTRPSLSVSLRKTDL